MQASTIDERINDAVAPFSEAFSNLVFFEIPVAGVGVPVVVAWRVLRGDFDSPDAPGEITHFQALTTALSGTVGIGNIGGVAAAITVGDHRRHEARGVQQ